jgi:TRAP transporter TAXI family solute receptor
VAWLVVIFVLFLIGHAKGAGPEYKIVTASERGTYIIIGRDLATHIAPDAGFDLEALSSAGCVENIRRLRFEPGVKFAICQSDAMRALMDQAEAGNKEAATLVRPLRVILPLYNEEIYFVVRADSPLKFVHEIKDARINAGPIGSGTALTTLTLYRAMFKAEPQATYMTNEDALLALTSGKTDAVVIVGGQPMKLLADMKPEAKALVRLLEFDASNPASRDVLKTYFPATVSKASYPNLLDADLPALATKAYLVTYDFRVDAAGAYLRKFARSLCANFASLQKFGHPKWKEVALELPELGEGWAYYPATAQEIRNCAKPVRVPAKPVCSAQELVLGLCGAVK